MIRKNASNKEMLWVSRIIVMVIAVVAIGYKDILKITNEENIKVPNVIGLSSKTANNILSKLGLNVKLEGVGYVTAQSIPADTKITEGLEMTLTLQPKFTA